MFQVFENNKPCDTTGYPKIKAQCWSNSRFNTFEEAREYARKWLGDYTGVADMLKPDEPYDYDGYGDLIEIRTVS